MASFNNTALDMSSNVIDYLVGLSSRFTKISDTELKIDNYCSFTFDWNTNYTAKVVYNGTDIISAGGTTYNGNLRVKTLISDDFIYFSFNRNPQNDNFNVFIFAKDNDGNFLVGYVTGTQSQVDAHNMSLTNLNDSTTGYVFPKMINFAAPTGSIGYSSIAPLTNGGSLALYAEDVLSCSTVSKDSTITLPNGKVYYAIGSNLMVEVDT